MFEKKCYIISSLIIFFSILIYGIFYFSKNIVIDKFKPTCVVFLIDSSKSNQKNIKIQKKFIKHFCSLLDPEDKIKILRVADSSYLIYEGSPQDANSITKSLNAHTQSNKNEKGTSYGIGIKKAIQHCLVMTKNGYIPSIVVIGDLEDEGNGKIDWSLLPTNIKNSLKYMPDLSMLFLWAEPEKLDLVKEKLTPILGEDKLIIATDITVDKVTRNFYKAIGR